MKREGGLSGLSIFPKLVKRMRTFCEDFFGYWLYHPIDTKLICENRVKLSIPECLKCKGITLVNKKEKPRSPFYCNKYDLKITQCSKHPEFNGRICNECIQPESKTSQVTPFFRVIARRGLKKSGKNPKTYCSICKEPIFDNVGLKKIIICGTCVQRLLTLPEQDKMVLRDELQAMGDKEAVRSIESFLPALEEQKGEGEVRIFKTQRGEVYYGREEETTQIDSP
jgi:hypothetical protein